MTRKTTPAFRPDHPGQGLEWHQVASGDQPRLTTNDGAVVSDNQNTLKAHPRGPSLLADVVLQEKLSQFDRERMPERVVHARGSGAHGHFELTASLAAHTTASVLTQVGRRTPVFARLSTVAGPQGSADTVRDVRGFAVKFYTEQGNWDLVGNNIPVFFIQDAMKFPDLVHAVKREPDRGFPSAASAHDTFWDFVSHMPESLHMLQWVMSDRAIPRSLRTMEGFGVHTFKLINAKGESTLVKYHWRPRLGLQSLVWDEAVKIAGADPDFHRRDLWEAIDRGDFPVWDLAVQLFTEAEAEALGIDPLDPTQLIPEEDVPLQVIGHMELNRNPDNFFAETEQVAFCPSRIVPGMDFSDDPLLHGRLFSYRDTQTHRLGSVNFQQLPINRPKCPVHHFYRDGAMQGHTPAGQVAYEPNGLAPEGPREHPDGLQAAPTRAFAGPRTRERASSFGAHHQQARRFYLSQTQVEQGHIAAAFTFELAKVESAEIRQRVVAHLRTVHEELGQRVARGLGLQPVPPAMPVSTPIRDLPPSPALGLIEKMKPTLQGRSIGVLIHDGSDANGLKKLQDTLQNTGARVVTIAPRRLGVTLSDGQNLDADAQLAGAPSVLFDAIAVLLTPQAADELATQDAALGFVRDAHAHLKAICMDPGGQSLLQAADLVPDRFYFPVSEIRDFMGGAATRLWDREARLRPQP